jgi:hypothetical protein
MAVRPELPKLRYPSVNPAQLVSVRPTAVHPGGTHTPAPGPLVLPAAHATHVFGNAAPTAAEAVLLPHSVHCAAPVLLAKLPGPQRVHEAATQLQDGIADPAAQGEQVVVPAGAILPGAHTGLGSWLLLQPLGMRARASVT